MHRAGGVMAILAELDRAGLLNRDVPTSLGKPIGALAAEWDISTQASGHVHVLYRAAPGGVRSIKAFSQDCRFYDLDLFREAVVIRDVDHAFSKDGGLAVLYSNLVHGSCVVKAAGVPERLRIRPLC